MGKGYKQFGLSLKNAEFKKIESERGLVPRSKFIALIIEQHYANREMDGGADAMQKQQAPTTQRRAPSIANQPPRMLRRGGEMLQ